MENKTQKTPTSKQPQLKDAIIIQQFPYECTCGKKGKIAVYYDRAAIENYLRLLEQAEKAIKDGKVTKCEKVTFHR